MTSPEERIALETAAAETIARSASEFQFRDGRILLQKWRVERVDGGFDIFDIVTGRCLGIKRESEEETRNILNETVVSWYR